jgi:hypothetical protein
MEHYVIDTNCLNNLNLYSKEVFPSLWSNFISMVKNGEIFSLKEVRAELSQANGKVGEYWDQFDTDSNFFIELGDDEISCVEQLEQFEEFQKAGENKSYFADPFLIATAMSKNCTVLSDERKIQSKSSIPYVCNQMGVKYMNLTEFMIHQGWKW